METNDKKRPGFLRAVDADGMLVVSPKKDSSFDSAIWSWEQVEGIPSKLHYVFASSAI
jgi:hypothetical protein